MSDLIVDSVSIVPGQEPDLLDEEFVTTMYVTFRVGGKLLASLLDKQQRVVERHLESLRSKRKEDTLLSLLQTPRGRGTKAVKEILKALKKHATREMASWLSSEGKGSLGRVYSVEFDADSTWRPFVKVFPKKEFVLFSDLELSVEGKVNLDYDDDHMRLASVVARRYLAKG